ncbi:RNA ligase partner protein [Candidatus Roizmanbacteria bacterium]|nr:RNA ligase partner protein [Candidatus Roizmanbacteria bacterium]
MDHYILDTNLFFNMEAGLDLGRDTETVVRTITKTAAILRKQGSRMYMPPRIMEEFLSFFENKNQKFIQEFQQELVIQSPDIHTEIPASAFYQFVEETRGRSYRGLTIAEEEIQKGAQVFLSQSELSKKDFEIKIGPVIRHFRERYRQATRFGFLDSVADLDSIMLAKQLNAYLVSTDEGVIKWGRILGVKEMLAPVFGRMVQKILEQ